MPALKPLLVFGLRGTLLERIHVRNVPEKMPAPDLTVGTSKIWLRPHMVEVLRALQPHCRLAIWSSTTSRNTHPLISAVFDTAISPSLAAAAAVQGIASRQPGKAGGGFGRAPAPATAEAGEASASSNSDGGSGSVKAGRFDKKKRTAASAEALATPSAATGEMDPIRFEFVWSREHTRADDFRRLNASVSDDSHATVKDLGLIFAQFPELAQPENTVLIDDTPSKAKLHADNYLWLDSCQEMSIADTKGMLRLQDFVMSQLVPAKDVRDVLCRRIRNGQ